MPRTVDVDAAVAIVARGGVVTYPTEAVWGLGCDPFDEAAVHRLLAIKRRDMGKGLILVASSADQLDGLVDWRALPDARRDDVLATWPGPHTWTLPATARVPRWIIGDHAGVAVRVSTHPVVAALCRGFGAPLVSTSANNSGEAPPRDVADLNPALLSMIDAVVVGSTSAPGRPTPIRDALTGHILRA